jgi:membrane protease subunit HflK
MTRRTVWLVMGALALYLATGLTQVRPGEVGVVRRLGRVLEDLARPGLHWSLPWGLGRIDRLAIDEQRQVTVGFLGEEEPLQDRLPLGQVLTADDQLLNLRVTLYFRVEEAGARDYVVNQERIEQALARLAEETLVVTLGSQRASQVLLGQARGLEADLQAALAARVKSLKLGLRIESVNVVHAQPPADLVEVYRQVNRARTQREILEREAQSRKQTEISAARQDASRIVAEAKTSAEEKRARAKAEAERFAALLASLPTEPAARQAALLNLYLTEMQAILPRMQVRTLSDQGVDQTIILPGSGR